MASHRDASVVVRSPRERDRGRSLRGLAFVAVLLVGVLVPDVAGAASLHAVTASAAPDFGPNVKIFDPSMSTSEIKATVDAIAAQQVSNQFGTRALRTALHARHATDRPPTPLNFQVGYYTEVAGLGSSPNDVTVNGTIDVYNQCFGPGDCTALVNFWRSLSNLTINVAGKAGCQSGEFWATSQAAPMRRVHVNGFMTLMDYCTAPVVRQRRLHRRLAVLTAAPSSTARSSSTWSGTAASAAGRNGVWNQVFAGVQGAPAQSFPNPPYTTLDTNPASREKPFLYVDANGSYNVFVPDAQLQLARARRGRTARRPGHSIPIEDFFIAKPTDSVQSINNALSHGKNLIFTPGVYDVDKTIKVKRAGHDRARPRHGDAHRGERRRPDDGRRREGRRHLRV